MGAVRMCVRSVLRHRLWGAVAVALLVGIAGGAVLAAYAGARRTESAFPRLLDRVQAADLLILPRQYEGIRAEDLAKLPGVERAGLAFGFGFGTDFEKGFPTNGAGALASDGTSLYQIERPLLTNGRLPRRTRTDEVLVSETAARQLGVRLGSRLRGSIFDFSTDLVPGADLSGVFESVDLRVVGVGRSANEIVHNENSDPSTIMLTPEFVRRHRDRVGYAAALVHLRQPEDRVRFEAALADRYPDVQFQFEWRSDREATFANTVGPYADALWFFAAVAALTALLVVGQALARLVVSDSGSGTELEALGARRPQRAATAGGRALGVVAVGGFLAVVIAAVTSPLFPLGPARSAEPDPGLHLDGVVLVGGLLAVIVVLGLVVGVVAWRLARSVGVGAGTTNAPWRPARGAERLARSGAPASLVNGVRFATQSDRSARSGSLVTTFLGLVVAVATIGAALTFGASLDGLVTTPRSYGWTWDALLDTYDQGASRALLTAVQADSDLPGITIGTRGSNVRIGGRVLPALGLRHVRGSALPRATEGRFPAAPDEVAFGARTLRDLGRSVGDTVRATAADGAPLRLQIVGTTVLPALSLAGDQSLGEGIALTKAGMDRLDPLADPSFFLLDLAPGVTLPQLNERYDDLGVSALGPQRPGDVTAYAGVRSTPLVLAGLLALLAVGVLVHLLLTSVRARRRDLAILKTLGCSRRQVAATVAWQATTLAGVALVVGIPIGVIAGRMIWRAFADRVGVDAGVVVPALAFVAIVVVGVTLANLIAAFPARAAARTRPALVLRSE